MAVTIKTPDEVEKMRTAGKLAASVLDMIAPYVKPNITTDELNQICHDYMVDDLKVIPAPLNYRGFPKSICSSVNHVVCHGIPNDRKLKDGDIVNLDITVIYEGYHGDTSKMFYVGNPSIQRKRVCEISHDALLLGIRMVQPGVTLGDIGHAIQTYAEGHNCSVVREYCGHGIGRNFHEDPQVLHYGKPGTGMTLEKGMTFTIEPMVNLGKRHVSTLPDGWTVVTKDRKMSAQWEHTILVTDTGYEVLTLRSDEHI
jgi:methionyl aminopeptidase